MFDEHSSHHSVTMNGLRVTLWLSAMLGMSQSIILTISHPPKAKTSIFIKVYSIVLLCIALTTIPFIFLTKIVTNEHDYIASFFGRSYFVLSASVGVSLSIITSLYHERSFNEFTIQLLEITDLVKTLTKTEDSLGQRNLGFMLAHLFLFILFPINDLFVVGDFEIKFLWEYVGLIYHFVMCLLFGMFVLHLKALYSYLERGLSAVYAERFCSITHTKTSIQEEMVSIYTDTSIQ